MTDKLVAGWREWVSVPTLGVASIKAKLDTGARSSALHAYDVTRLTIEGKPWVRFGVHPFQRNDSAVRNCLCPVVDERIVTNPGGRRQRRIIIEVDISMGQHTWPIELSLTDRDEMGFRMLIGRTAMHGLLIVDPDASYRLGRLPRKRKKLAPGKIRARKSLNDAA
jgi:hypothetical protein